MPRKSAEIARIGKIACVWAALPLAAAATLFAPHSRAADPDAPKQADAAKKVPGKIAFVGKNTVATANGTFKQWRFTDVKLDPDNEDAPIRELAIEVDIASLDTANKKRDDHLRTADFFDVEKYPKARLKLHSAKLKPKTKNVNLAKIDVDLHGVKKTLDLEFEIADRDPLRIRGRLVMKRTDFNIGKPPSSLNPMSIDDDVPVTFNAVIPIPKTP